MALITPSPRGPFGPVAFTLPEQGGTTLVHAPLPLVQRDPAATAWAAGLFEGEGTLGPGNGGTSWTAGLAMTDEDVVRRFADVAGCGKVRYSNPPSRSSRGWSPLWWWRVSANLDLIEFMLAIRPHLGVRRTSTVEALLRWYADGEAGDYTAHNASRRALRASRRSA